MKFQWSKVASVLGSYEDFIKSYGMSISAAGFSNDQIAAQLDTINRKYEQLKATMTGIATGMGASGLSAYIKNILASLNRFAQAMQRIPTSTYDMIGSLIKLGAIFGSTIVIIRTLVTGIYGLRAAYIIATTAQAANTAGTTVNTAAKAKNYAMSLLGVNAARAQATASVTAVGAMAAETAATEAATVATGGFAATVTAATGGLNLIIAAIAAAVVGFFAYNTTVSATAESQDKLKESSEELIAIEQQKLDMVRKEADFVETLIRAHFKLAEQVDNTSNSEQKNEQIKRDLQATDKELARIIGEDGLKRIQSSKDVNTAVEHEREVYKNKAKNIVQNMINVATAEQEFNQKTLQGIVDRIDALKSEVSSWDLWSQAVHAAMQVYAGYLDLKEKGVDWTLSHSDPNSAQYQRAAEQKASIANERAWANKRPEGVETKIAELEGQKLEVEKKVASNSLQLANLELQLAQIESGKGLEDLPTDVTDSGIVSDDDKDKKGTKGTKTPRGAQEADNSPMAMSYRYLTSAKHLDKNFVAGLLGNAIRETGGWDLNPDADNGSHRGLFQWSYNDASRIGRWYDFMDTFLKERNISESQYWAMDKDQKRTLQLDFGLYEMQEGKEWASYKKILDQRPSTPEQWASLINQHFERSGEPAGSPIDMERQGNARQIAEKYGKNNGEINYTDIDALIKKNYQEVKRVYDEKLESLKYEREKIGQSVSASEKLNLYKEIVNPNDFAALKEARKDYKALLLEAIKEERKRLEASKSATDTQVKAVEKMADAEIAFAEKLGLINKSDVRKYEWEKNESNYAKNKPLLDAKLGSTVDMSKGTADDILAAYRGYVNAKTDLDAKYYAEKMFNLSRDVDATMKALNEVYKLEQSYYEKRKKINDEEFLYKSRYATTFIDSLTNGIQSGLEGILNRTKSFAEAFRDIFKGLVQDIIKLFSQDFAERIKKWLSNAIFKPKTTGNKAGAYEDIVGMKSAGGKSTGGDDNSFNLIGWAQNSLSSLGGGTDKGKGVGQNPLVKALGGYSFASEMRKAVQPGMIALRDTTQLTINGMSNITQQGMQTISGGIQTGTQAMTMTWQGMEVSKQMATEMGNAGIVASSQATAATVQATTAQMMGWLMAVLALFSLFGGGGGSSTTESHDSVNLGRSPDSYYMTPSAVLQSTTFQVPSFDIGGNIEQDMFAMVHKGEMVLTPEQAEVIRNTARTSGSVGNGNTNANVKSSINVTTVSSRGFEQVLRDYNRDLSKNVKKGIRNGYLTAKGLM